MLVNNDAKIYVGETPITKAYQGETLIYEKEEPPEYTVLNYLQSNGQAYINTDYVFTSNMGKIKTKFYHISGSKAVFGYYHNSGYYKTVLTAHAGKYYLSAINPIPNVSYSYNTLYEIEADIEGNSSRTGTYKLYSNGSLISSGTGVGIFPDSTSRNTMLLFAQQSPQWGFDSGANSRIYYFQMWDNDVLVRDFIPVLDPTNVPCMYDKVTKTYFYNKGSGIFTYE